jgi:hypothetical protein
VRHNYLFKNFAIQQDKSLTSKGSVTNTKGKRCPKRLVPWADFSEKQKEVLGKLYAIYPEQSREYESLDFLRGLGERVAKRKVANEKDLEHIQHDAVETPVVLIIDHLVRLEGIDEVFRVGNGIIFENHPNVVSDIADEPSARQRRQP